MAGKKKPKGRPEWSPTPEQRGRIAASAQYGATNEQIAADLGIDVKTLKKHCAEELKKRRSTILKIAETAYRLALDGNEKMITLILTTKDREAWSTAAKDQEAADRRRFAHEKEMAKLNAELRNTTEDDSDFPLLPAIYEESPEVKH